MCKNIKDDPLTNPYTSTSDFEVSPRPVLLGGVRFSSKSAILDFFLRYFFWIYQLLRRCFYGKFHLDPLCFEDFCLKFELVLRVLPFSLFRFMCKGRSRARLAAAREQRQRQRTRDGLLLRNQRHAPAAQEGVPAGRQDFFKKKGWIRGYPWIKKITYKTTVGAPNRCCHRLPLPQSRSSPPPAMKKTQNEAHG